MRSHPQFSCLRYWLNTKFLCEFFSLRLLLLSHQYQVFNINKDGKILDITFFLLMIICISLVDILPQGPRLKMEQLGLFFFISYSSSNGQIVQTTLMDFVLINKVCIDNKLSHSSLNQLTP